MKGESFVTHIVSLLECRTYEYDLVKKAIVQSFENLGGISPYIQKGDIVLLKVNLLMKKTPEEATTTHPIFVKALAETLLAHGAQVLIGDSPGGPFNEKALRGVYRVCGMEQIAHELGCTLNYNTNSIHVKNKKGLLLKQLTVVEMLQDVTKVISVSKLKTHGMAMFTGAVKNMFGIVPGILKAEYHFSMPEIADFSDALIDICAYADPILSFMDGIVGMEGEGPSAGIPREIGVVLASTSPYHLDVAAAAIIGLTPTQVPTIKRSVARGLCSGTLEDIIFPAERPEKFLLSDYKIPKIRSTNLLPPTTPSYVKTFVNACLQPKPVFHFKDCVGCGICAESCPAKVLHMQDQKPIIDLNECIRCFCCQELCPKKAVTIHRPWIMKILSKI